MAVSLFEQDSDLSKYNDPKYLGGKTGAGMLMGPGGARELPTPNAPVEQLTGKQEIIRNPATGNLEYKTTTIAPPPVATTAAAPTPTTTAPTPTRTTTTTTAPAPQQGPAIAGVQSFDFNKKQRAGGIVANNSTSDWSPGSRNTQAVEGIAGMNVKPSSFTSYGTQAQTDEFGRALPDKAIVRDLGTLSNRGDLGRTYDEQVAKAQEVNAATMRQLAYQPSPKEASDIAIANSPMASAVTRRNAEQGVTAFRSRAAAYESGTKEAQAQEAIGMKKAAQRLQENEMASRAKEVEGLNVLRLAQAKEAKVKAELYPEEVRGKIAVAESKRVDTAVRDVRRNIQQIERNMAEAFDPKLKEQYAKQLKNAKDQESALLKNAG